MPNLEVWSLGPPGRCWAAKFRRQEFARETSLVALGKEVDVVGLTSSEETPRKFAEDFLSRSLEAAARLEGVRHESLMGY